MELTDGWVAIEADEDLRRVYPEVDYDDSEWHPLSVPGQWAATPWFADADGPVLHRARFSHQARPGTRSWLCLDGIFYRGDVWLDGSYVGDTEGYFVPHDFEITELLEGRDHVLAIEVDSPASPDSPRRVITGAFHDDPIGVPTTNPGGIWRPVRIEESGSVRLRGFRAICREATTERAIVALRAVADSAEPTTVAFVTTVAGVVHELQQPLAAGENQVEWTVAIPTPDLWWPHTLGEQPLHDLQVEVRLEDRTVSDQRRCRIGLRQVELDDLVLRVNGERLFTKGIAAGPTRHLLSIASDEELRGDVLAAREAGLDLIRLHTHVSRPELYTAADELGMLIWQDFPMHGAHARSTRAQAVSQSRAMVDLLGHHPSIAVWCAHDAPPTARPSAKRRPTVGLLSHQVPTWNRAILDRAVKRAISSADGSRPVLAHSGVPPHLPQIEGTDAHVRFGWASPDAAELADYLAGFPRQARWVTLLGAQSVPSGEAFVDTDPWPEIDWQALTEHFGLDPLLMARVPPTDHPSYRTWCDATQRYQAHLVKTQIEIVRRLKYRPSGGFTVHALADGSPSVSTSVLDFGRRPKQAYQALTDACRPVVVVAGPLPAVLAPGEPTQAPVHVISDRHGPTGPAEIRAVLRQPGRADQTWRWDGIVPFDDCVLVGEIAWTTTTEPGRVVLDLELTGEHLAVTNRYELDVAERRINRG